MTVRIIIDGKWTYWCDFADEIRVGQYVQLPSRVRGGVFCGEVTSLNSTYEGVVKAVIKPMPEIQSFEQKMAYNAVAKMCDTVRDSMKNIPAIERALSLAIANVQSWKMSESYKFAVCRLLTTQAEKFKGMIQAKEAA